MEQTRTNTETLPAIRRKQAVPPDPLIPEHVRGGEPKSIGSLMKPIRQIIKHPDRNRLLADFFDRNW